MMKMMAFSVRDSKAEVFSQPFFAQSKGAAVRSFADACNDKNHVFGMHPEDYTLFFIGEFQDDHGVLVPALAPEALGVGATFVQLSFPGMKLEKGGA